MDIKKFDEQILTRELNIKFGLIIDNFCKRHNIKSLITTSRILLDKDKLTMVVLTSDDDEVLFNKDE